MIARISFFLLLLIILPDVYLYRRYKARLTYKPRLARLLWWGSAVALAVYTIGLSLVRSFIPANVAWLNVYLLLLALLTLPKAVLALACLVGQGVRRVLHTRRNWGARVGLALAAAMPFVVLYGAIWGVRSLRVREVDLYFDTLPPAFEGYRIVHITDLHVGTLPRTVLRRAVDSIQALRPDAVMMTGDVQNMLPQELAPVMPLLSSVKARDGVFAVLGNHDYAMYASLTDAEKQHNEAATREAERQCGWQLLLNEHRVIRRGADSIVVAGEENQGRPPFPARADMRKTLAGVADGAFVVLMQHDPWAWEHHILPSASIPLTLSGHTHGGQLSLFGWRPTQLTNKEDSGLYHDATGRHALYVSTGLGGVLPFRLGVSPEIVVITLHRAGH